MIGVAGYLKKPNVIFNMQPLVKGNTHAINMETVNVHWYFLLQVSQLYYQCILVASVSRTSCEAWFEVDAILWQFLSLSVHIVNGSYCHAVIMVMSSLQINSLSWTTPVVHDRD